MSDAVKRFGLKLRPGKRPKPSAEDPEIERTRPCPHCKGPVSLGATVCIHCERDLVPLLSYSEFARRFGSRHAGGPPHARPGDSPGQPESGDPG